MPDPLGKSLPYSANVRGKIRALLTERGDAGASRAECIREGLPYGRAGCEFEDCCNAIRYLFKRGQITRHELPHRYVIARESDAA